MNQDDLQKELCRQLCADIQLVEREDKTLMISNPFSYPDGDQYSIYLKEIDAGRIRLSDKANTMMRLSYDTPDIEKYFKGNRGELMQKILLENKIQEEDGNFYIDTSVDKIAESIFRLGQALNQIYDLSYLNRDSSTSTFYQELEELLNKIVSEYPVKLVKDYVVPNLENAENYVIDYSLQQDEKFTLFLFGIPNLDKAQFVTITLQRLLLQKFNTPTLLIFKEQENIPPKRLSRLTDANVGGSQVSSLGAIKSLEQNIKRYVVAR